MPARLFSEKPFDSHRSDTEYALSMLSEYHGASEAALVKAEQEMSLRLNQEFANITGDENLLAAAEEYMWHVGKFRQVFLRKLRYSFVIQTYIVFETRAKALCDELYRRRPKPGLRVDNVRYLKDIRSFLEAYKVPNTHWDALDDLRLIRNCLAHANGLVSGIKKDDDRNAVEGIIKSGRGVAVDDEGYLMIERSFCDTAFVTIRSFFQSMFDACGFGDGFSFGRDYVLGVEIRTIDGKSSFRLLGKDELKDEDGP